MAGNLNVQIKGAKQLNRVLRALPDRIHKQALRNGLAAGGRVFRDAARNEAPRGKTGNLRKGIKVIRRRGTRDSVHVTVGSTAPHSHLIEFGTSERETKTGKSTGAIRTPNRFMTRAFDNNQEKVIHSIVGGIKSSIQRARTRGVI